MRRRRILSAVGVASAGALAGCGGWAPTGDEADGEGASGGDGGGGGANDATAGEWPAGTYADYETATVTVTGADGAARGSVRAAIADTRDKRILGLSAAPSLPDDAGMLFVYDAPQESLTYIMPEMSFGIDIVYVNADRAITRIHNAPKPGPDEDGSEQRYPGSGQYVLEVPYRWTDRNDVAVGDTLSFQL